MRIIWWYNDDDDGYSEHDDTMKETWQNGLYNLEATFPFVPFTKEMKAPASVSSFIVEHWWDW